MNPIFPRHDYIPDTEARVWADGRLYLYGSRDIGGVEDYCSPQYKVYSTADLIHWTDHGISFDGSQADFCPSDTLFAPDCVYRNDQYYLFYCLPGEGGREGVAVSEHPQGPFRNLGPVVGADGTGIDPAVLVDDDGSAYLYWGQFELRVAKLSDDMRAILPETLQVGVLNEAEHGFHEGASIRKIDGKYYLVYCDCTRGRAASLSYAVADTPFGPFVRQGVIINNANCDPLSWNIHGSLFHFQDQWYISYHRSSANSRYNRRACIEPITIHSDGRIDEVKPSTQGAGPAIPATTQIGAWRACSLYGRLHTVVEANTEFLRSQGEGNIAEFSQLHFDAVTTFHVRARGEGKFLLNLGSACQGFSGSIEVNSPEAWTDVKMTLASTSDGPASAHFYFLQGTVDVAHFHFS